MDQGNWLTIEKRASYAKMGRIKLCRLSQEGELPASKIGHHWRFNRDEIDAWMKAQRHTFLKKSVRGGSR